MTAATTTTTTTPYVWAASDRHAGVCPASVARRRRRRAAVVGAAVGGICLVTSGAFAAWQATSSVSSASVDAASVGVEIVDASSGSFSTAVPNLLPGDYFHRYVDLQNRGTVASTFAGTVSASGTLGAALGLGVEQCSVAWNTANGTCAGTVTTLLPATPSAASVAVSYRTIAPGAAQAAHVRYRFELPASAPATLMGQASSISATVSGTLVGGNDRTQG